MALQALALAKDLHLQNIFITSDCKQVISDIAKKVGGTYGVVVSEINKVATHFQCDFSFECHVVNYEARSLAGRGSERYVWLGNHHDPHCIPHHVDFEKNNLVIPLKNRTFFVTNNVP